MADDSEYELLPHEELQNLRDEVERLKDNPLGKRYGGVDLIDSIHNLTQSIDSMNRIFESTNKEMLDDFREKSISEHFRAISSQNEQIARGIVSVVELVQKQTELIEKMIKSPETQTEIKSTGEFPKIPKDESVEQQSNTEKSLDNMPPFEHDEDMPAIPPLDVPPPKKKGLFGKF